jgi:hypothetical protein
MIWFACKQCGKCHGRAERLAGTLVFCECGQGNRVPWTSTVAEPEPEEALPASPPRAPTPGPPLQERRAEPERFPPRRSRERRQPNPAYCLNHEETPKEAVCDACHCSFCSACVVTLRGQTLCGPCKNSRLGSLSRPPRILPLAIVAFVLALIGTLFCVFLCFLAIGLSVRLESGLAGSVFCCTIALLLAAGELIVSAIALRLMDRQPALGGRDLAMTGAVAGLTGVVWAFALALFIVLRQV